MELKNGERIDDLCRNGYRIIQNGKKFCFGIDAVLLSDFASVRRGAEVLDLGTGTGVIPILLKAKTEGRHFTGLEIQEDMAEMAGRSVRMNNLEKDIDIVTGDIREAHQLFGRETFDTVTCNPPYRETDHGRVSSDDAVAVSKHEILCTLEDVIRESAALLKNGGIMDMVHRPRRLSEIIVLMTQYRLEPKRLRFVYPYACSEANLVLIEGVKNGGRQLTVEKPLIVYEKEGVYTDEIHQIYGEL